MFSTSRFPMIANSVRWILVSGTLLSFSLISAIAQPTVSSVSPTPQAIDANVASDILISFVAPIDPTTVTAQSFRVFGRWSGPASGTITFEDSNKRIRFNPSANFFAGEWITVSLSNTVTDTGSMALATGYSWNFWTATATGTLDLTNIGTQTIRGESEGQIISYGAYAGDLDDDGWSDLVIPNENTNDIRVFMNNGGSFGAFESTYSLHGTGRPSPNEGADFNNDGNLDVAVGALATDQISVFLGDGTGSLSNNAGYTTGFDIRGVCVADYDADGDEDLVVAARSSNDLAVLENNGSGVFSSGGLFSTNGSSTTSCAVADANEDGIMDVFVGGFSSQELGILLGDGNGTFTFSSEVSTAGFAWMITTGDVNGDGHADVVSAGGHGNEFTVALGDGNGGFISSESIASDNFLVAIDLGDVDGDGDLDLAVSSISNSRWSLYENDGTGAYDIAPRTFDAPGKASCAIFHDRDNDGDLDMTTIDEGDDLLIFFDNDNGPLSVELTSFDVLTIGDDLTLRWKTAIEVDNLGFHVERSPFNNDVWSSVGFVDGAGSTTSTQSYSFSLSDTEPGRYRFRLRQVDFDGAASYSNEITVVLGAPHSITLSPAFPNPFDDVASFDIVVPQMQEVEIDLLNLLGQSVRSIYSGYLSGLDRHAFTIDSQQLPSGLYLVRVVSRDQVVTTSVMLSK